MATAIILGLLSPLIEVGKLLARPFSDTLSYLYYLNENVQCVESGATNLNIEIQSLEEQVKSDENIRRRILPIVTNWLEDAKRMEKNADDIKKEKREIDGKCCALSMKSRYLLSKNAKNLVAEMKDHRDNRHNLDPISQPPLPSSQLPPQAIQGEEFSSRKGIEENVMKAIGEKTPKLIGIWGMGGLGKTTMAEKLMQRVSEDKLFHEVLKVDVGKDANVLEIQRKIAVQLGLKLEANLFEEDIKRKLLDRLSGEKRIFILLDDIWKQLELANLGLPLEKCTILLTSRNRDELEKMNVDVFDMKLLEYEEALALFTKQARIGSDNQKLFSKAEEIVKECNGLPLAIAVIGSYLRCKKNDKIWADMLLQLRRFNVENIGDFYERVYCVTKFSIDRLDNEDAKQLLFLCSQFPKYVNINLDDLALYCMSLRLFRKSYNLVETRARVCTVVEMLKNHSLLLVGHNNTSVKMHDLIRDTVANVIADIKKKSHSKSDSDCISYLKWISDKYPETNDEIRPDHLARSSCQKVDFLGIVSVDQPRIEVLLSSCEAREISSLVLRRASSKLLPESIKLLKCLRMLDLENCVLESISVVGQLLKLEVLKCLYCNHIKELPLEIKELKHLKFIEFGRCSRLTRIAPGILPHLVDLEELAIWDCFSGWESRNVKKLKERNASLQEIESLKKLRVLKIAVADIHLLEDNMQLPSSLENYGICIGTTPHLCWDEKYEKWISLSDVRQGVNYGNWINQLMLTAERIACHKVGVNANSFIKFPLLAKLKNSGWRKFTELVPSIERNRNSMSHNNDRVLFPLSNNQRVSSECFPSLESLELEDLPNLEEIIDYSVSLKTNKLEILVLKKLPALKYLWNSSHQWLSPPNLSCLDIEKCDNLHNLFSGTRSSTESCSNDKNGMSRRRLTFSKLTNLKVSGMNNLETLCDGVESVEFPMLKEIVIDDCPKLMSIVSSTGSGLQQNMDADGHTGDPIHLICWSKVTFGRLEMLTIRAYPHENLWCREILPSFFKHLERLNVAGCDEIQILFSFSIAAFLENLKVLKIGQCKKLKKVIGDEESVSNNPIILFPRLTAVLIEFVPLLENFCNWKSDVELPLLEDMHIHGSCPQMKYFTAGSLTTPKLYQLCVSSGAFYGENLNQLGVNEIIRRQY